jgi:hypothetical protein
MRARQNQWQLQATETLRPSVWSDFTFYGEVKLTDLGPIFAKPIKRIFRWFLVASVLGV